MEKVSLSVELVNSILQYLGTRPFVEVATMIQKVQMEAGSQVPAAPDESEADAA